MQTTQRPRWIVILIGLVLAACGGAPFVSPGDGGGGGSNDAGSSPTSDGGSSGSLDAGFDASPVALGPDYFFLAGSFGPVGDLPMKGPLAGGSVGLWRILLPSIHVDVSKTWPTTLAPYRVIVIWAGAILDDGQAADLRAWVMSGGRLVLTGEYDFGPSVPHHDANVKFNAVLQSWGINISIVDPIDIHGTFAMGLVPAFAPATQLTCRASGYLTVGAGAQRGDTVASAHAYLAYASLGAGRVIVLADSTCLADYSYTYTDVNDNFRIIVLDEANTLLGPFVHRLATF